MTSPALAGSSVNPSEKTRELAKAYGRAEVIYTETLHLPRLHFTEDQHADHLIAIEKTRAAMQAAYMAFRNSMDASK